MREVVTLKEYYISIHALRVEGDVIYIFIFVFVPSISIHALRVEGDPHNMYAIACTHFISIHALRVEGDHPSAKSISKKFYFYPRPPGGGRPFQLSTGLPQKHFYPRPPGGGRRAPFFALCSICRFLSTPSGWRATDVRALADIIMDISIHALRVEGDTFDIPRYVKASLFLSTPSGWRATKTQKRGMAGKDISIHALRVEGDIPLSSSPRACRNFYPRPPGGGRRAALDTHCPVFDFYPRPPGGGRRTCGRWRTSSWIFLSTPSGWRATPVESFRPCLPVFLSTPSGWRATARV